MGAGGEQGALADEVRGRFCAVLETPSGDAYHVPLDARSAEALGVGDVVVFGTRPERLVRAVDRTIVREAAAGGGVWNGLAAAGEVQAMEHRLRELERLGLVKHEGAHGWRVPLGLLQQEARRSGRGRSLRGTGWCCARTRSLSRNRCGIAGPLRSIGSMRMRWRRSGLGRRCGGCCSGVMRCSASSGWTPEDRRRFGQLREMERRAVGEAITARTGQAFIADAPEGFRGRVARAGPRTPDSDYAVVSDGARFVVLRAGPALLGATGKTCVLARDARGQVVVRPAPDRDLAR